MLLGTLGASLLGNLLTGKGVNKKGKGIHRAGEGIVFLIPSHPLTNFEIIKCYKNESRFTGVYSRDNLPNKIKDGVYVINLDEYSYISTHWIASYVKNNEVTYFDSFVRGHIPKEIKAFVKNRNIKTNVFRMQEYDSITCGYFCIVFIDFMFKRKTLTEYKNVFSPNDFKRNDDTILNYFMKNT